MKFLLISLFAIVIFTGCQDSRPSKDKISLMGGGVNPNTLAYTSLNNQKNRENRVEISKIDSSTQIKIAEIKSQNQLKIAQVNAKTQKDVAVTDSTTKIKTSEIEAVIKKDDIQNDFYISILVMLGVLLAAILLYFNNKKNRELKDKIHQEDLKHEQLLKEREHDEKRLHKMLELVESGKLTPEMEREVITSLTKPSTNLLESK